MAVREEIIVVVFVRRIIQEATDSFVMEQISQPNLPPPPPHKFVTFATINFEND
jgi:hypothetical protein